MSYIPHATSSHEQTVRITTFAQFEEVNLLEKEHNLVEDKSISASIYESSADDNSDGESIITDALEDIWGGSYVHLNINARYAILKIRHCIRQAQSEWRRVEISVKRVGKGLHKVFKVILK